MQCQILRYVLRFCSIHNITKIVQLLPVIWAQQFHMQFLIQLHIGFI